MAAARKGEGLAPQNSEGHTEFTPLLDSIAVAAARALNPVGFDGLQLEVGGCQWGRWVGASGGDGWVRSTSVPTPE